MNLKALLAGLKAYYKQAEGVEKNHSELRNGGSRCGWRGWHDPRFLHSVHDRILCGCGLGNVHQNLQLPGN